MTPSHRPYAFFPVVRSNVVKCLVPEEIDHSFFLFNWFEHNCPLIDPTMFYAHYCFDIFIAHCDGVSNWLAYLNNKKRPLSINIGLARRFWSKDRECHPSGLYSLRVPCATTTCWNPIAKWWWFQLAELFICAIQIRALWCHAQYPLSFAVDWVPALNKSWIDDGLKTIQQMLLV